MEAQRTKANAFDQGNRTVPTQQFLTSHSGPDPCADRFRMSPTQAA